MILRTDIQNDFDRVVQLYTPRQETLSGGLSEYEVLKAHYIVSDYFISEGDMVLYGVKSFDLLSSAVSRQEVEFGGVQKWQDEYHKMATLLYGITKNHAFEDGNKRTALLSLLLFINKSDLQVAYKQSVIENLIVRIAANTLDEYANYKYYKEKDDPEVNFIADKIKKYTRKTNRRIYTITYAEFDRRLKQFGVWLDNPSGNFINVYRNKQIIRLFLFTKNKTERVLQIGFPGWKRQVNPKTIKSVLQATGLTVDNGVDSEVFFRDADPIYELIREFREPLVRLKDE
jgi:death-on-curing protein